MAGMDFDIVRKIKLSGLKAKFQTLNLKHKLFLMIFLFSLLATLVPHETYAAGNSNQTNPGPVLLFNLSVNDVNDYLETRSQELSDAYYKEQVRFQILRQQKLTEKIRSYLQAQGSPMAEFAQTLVTLRNWKKIVALANAESSLCRKYPTSKANCWGVGGANLWDMGNDLGQGIVSMNHFLNKYPLRSPIKYAQMNFDQMNGLYKQPPGDHWVYNGQSVYDNLLAIENSL